MCVVNAHACVNVGPMQTPMPAQDIKCPSVSLSAVFLEIGSLSGPEADLFQSASSWDPRVPPSLMLVFKISLDVI
jgi:hypothetical protein